MSTTAFSTMLGFFCCTANATCRFDRFTSFWCRASAVSLLLQASGMPCWSWRKGHRQTQPNSPSSSFFSSGTQLGTTCANCQARSAGTRLLPGRRTTLHVKPRQSPRQYAPPGITKQNPRVREQYKYMCRCVCPLNKGCCSGFGASTLEGSTKEEECVCG